MQPKTFIRRNNEVVSLWFCPQCKVTPRIRISEVTVGNVGYDYGVQKYRKLNLKFKIRFAR